MTARRPRATSAATDVPDLRIRLTRRTDGATVLACERRDGTSTWQRQEGATGAVFPLHDLTHLAVETTLGYRDGFFGLVADGWAIADFAPPWPRGPVPRAAREAELVVGVFDMARLRGDAWSAAELCAHGARFAATGRAGREAIPFPALSDDDVARVRAARAALFARWAAVPAGGTLALAFVRPPPRG